MLINTQLPKIKIGYDPEDDDVGPYIDIGDAGNGIDIGGDEDGNIKPRIPLP
jgi:hypothetical protein